MNSSVTSKENQALDRLVYLLALVNSHAILYLYGPDFGPSLVSVMLSPEVFGTYYGRTLLVAARQAIARSPEIIDALNTEDWEESVVQPFIAWAKEEIKQQVPQDQVAELRRGIAAAAASVERVMTEVQGDDRSPLGDALEVNLERVASEPGRLSEVFSPQTLGLHPREIDQLEDALGIDLSNPWDQSGTDQFAQAIFPQLLQVSAAPQDVHLPPLRRTSRVWQWAGIPKAATGEPEDLESMSTGIAELLGYLGQQEHRQELARYVLARLLRQEYGLNRGRKVVDPSPRTDEDGLTGSESPLENYRDAAADEDFQEADNQLLLEEVLKLASPAQLEAAQIYQQAEESGKPVADLCRSAGRDPNTVRNNFRAFQKKIKVRMAEP